MARSNGKVSFGVHHAMPAYHKRDPRSYVKQVPLPIGSQKGLKLQARSEGVYNPTVPARAEVRKENYDRRLQQRSEQGFQSPNYKPYKGIGDPFYLEQKKLILHALGQWDEKQHALSSSSDDSDDDEGESHQKTNLRSTSTAQFMLRRTRKDLNTLPKEMAHGRDLMKNCRLGWGLFDMLQREKKSKADAKLRDIRKQKERLRTEWQPPKYNSSDGETDEELTEEVDINPENGEKRFMSTSAITLDPAQSTVGDVEMAEVQEARSPSVKPPPSIHYPSALGYRAGTVTDATSTYGGTMNNMDDGESKSKVAFQGVESTYLLSASGDPSKTASIRSSSRVGSSKKRAAATRPYTPQHTNLSTATNAYQFDHNEKQAVFRQLCCLYWLLEAMNTDPPQTMSPISTSWNLNEIGGYKLKNKKQEDSKIEQEWKSVIRHSSNKPAQGRRTFHSNRRMRMLSATPRRFSSQPQHYGRQSSASSTLISPAGSMTHLNNSVHSTANRLSQPIPEDSEIKSTSGTGDGTDQEDHDSKDDYYSSVREPDQETSHGHSQEEKTSNLEIMSTRSDRTDISPAIVVHPTLSLSASQQRRKERNKSGESDHIAGSAAKRRPSTAVIPEYKTLSEADRKLILEKLNKNEEDPRFQRLANPLEKRSQKNLRAEYNVRPKSSAELLDYQANLDSMRLGTMSIDMRQRFLEVSEEKALDLHDALEANERDRMRKIQTKFSCLPTKGSFFRALKAMRAQNAADEELIAQNNRKNSIHQQWYTDILLGIPEPVMEEWNFKKVLDKLAKYGLVEASKQSAYKFLKVLSGMRDWEICGPDISASIEFCREKIVEMTVEDYEEWFTQQFPAVSRPSTAPAVMKTDKNKRDKVKSAPVSGRNSTTGLRM